MVSSASKSSTCVCWEQEGDSFLDFTAYLNGAYKKLKGIQSFQIFRASYHAMGKMYASSAPGGTEVALPLAPKGGMVALSELAADALFARLASVPAPTPNAEKVNDIYNKVRKTVPVEFWTDVWYQEPTAADRVEANAVKGQRKANSIALHRRKMSVNSGSACTE